MKIRTNIEDDDDNDNDGDDDDGDLEDIRLEAYDDEDPTETAEEAQKQQSIILSQVGQSYSFTVQARDILKYGPTANCPGCKFVTGEVTAQSGHNRECKTRIMDSMKKDREDKQRVRKWYTAKGIDGEETTFRPEDSKKEEDLTLTAQDEAQGSADTHAVDNRRSGKTHLEQQQCISDPK
jgi:hypothetical protein